MMAATSDSSQRAEGGKTASHTTVGSVGAAHTSHSKRADSSTTQSNAQRSHSRHRGQATAAMPCGPAPTTRLTKRGPTGRTIWRRDNRLLRMNLRHRSWGAMVTKR